jgi:CheY-like chemotaxis protein
VRLKVLIVEDEALVGMLIEDMLVEMGHEVVATAGRLDKALELAAGLAIDLAILDVNLNGERTNAAASLLRERGVPFLFATGYGEAGINGDSRIPVLQKPFELPALRAAITRATGKA